MLAQRLRRWANIKPTLVQRLIFAGMLRGTADNVHSVFIAENRNPASRCWVNVGPASQMVD